MKCDQFLKVLYEYAEGTLSPETQSAAVDHLAQCEACRIAVQREEIFGHAISRGLRAGTETLALGPEGRRRVLAGMKQGRETSLDWRAPGLWWRRWGWGAGAAAGTLVAALLAITLSSRNPKIEPADGKKGPPEQAWVLVHSSYVVPVYSFHQEDGMVTDFLVYRTNIVDLATWDEANRRDGLGQERMKEL